MIFGFNSEVQAGGSTYHVQSEARQGDLLLQTQIFVQGRCLGKRAASYADRVEQPGFSEQHMHELLKAQHKQTVDAIREGRLQEILGHANFIQDVDGSGLAVSWINADELQLDAGATATLRILVTDRGAPVEGAAVTSHQAGREASAKALTRADGTAEVRVVLEPDAGRELGVLIKASDGDKQATRKFRIRLPD